jgi:hypothetical protein
MAGSEVRTGQLKCGPASYGTVWMVQKGEKNILVTAGHAEKIS